MAGAVGCPVHRTEGIELIMKPLHLYVAWYGFIVTPLLALFALELKFSLVSWACGAGRGSTLHWVSFISILFTLTGVVLNVSVWRQMGEIRGLSGSAPDQWGSYLAVLGVLMSTLATLVVIAMWLPIGILGACD